MPVLMEPFRARVIEPIHETTRAGRQTLLEQAGFNLYSIDAEMVSIDLLTDSGTCAISTSQMAAMMRGDESYAGSASYRRFEAAVRDVFGFEHIVPVHQGRAAERLMMECLGRPGSLIASNTLFETTRANCLAGGMEPHDMPSESFWNFASADLFKGNLCCEQLEALLEGTDASRVAFILLTITNNQCGDQPVSMANIVQVHALARRHGLPLFIDACRFAQNAWFIQQHEDGFRQQSIRHIVHRMFELSDGCIFSAKKDALAMMGGFFACRSAELAQRVRERLLLSEGYITYGGMTGRDMEAIAVGLYEVLADSYLTHRMHATAYLLEQLESHSVPVLRPAGGHAVYIDATSLLAHLTPDENAGQALATEIYLEGGIRTARIALHPTQGSARGCHYEFVRLALPSRVYFSSHLDFVAESVGEVAKRAAQIKGLRVVSAPRLLSGFLARYERVDSAALAAKGAESKAALC